MTATIIIDRNIPCFTIDDYEDIKIRLHEAEELIGHLTGVEGAFKDDSLLIIAYTAMDKIREADKNLEAVWIRWKKPIASVYRGTVQPDEAPGKTPTHHGGKQIEKGESISPAKATPEIDRVALTHGLNLIDRLNVSLSESENPWERAIGVDLTHAIDVLQDANLFAVKVKGEGTEGGAEHGKREG